MDYCGPRALPHSQFLAWPVDDQDKVIAWMIHQRLRCSGCGTFPEDWVTEDGKPRIPPPHEVHHETCVGCQEKERYRKHLESEKQLGAGVYIVMREPDYDEYNPDLITE